MLIGPAFASGKLSKAAIPPDILTASYKVPQRSYNVFCKVVNSSFKHFLSLYRYKVFGPVLRRSFKVSFSLSLSLSLSLPLQVDNVLIGGPAFASGKLSNAAIPPDILTGRYKVSRRIIRVSYKISHRC